MPHDLRATIDSLLQDQGEDRLGAVVREAVRPIIHDAFLSGLRIGLGMARDGALLGMDNARREIEKFFEIPKIPQAKRKRTVARGTIGPLIDLVLANSPGLRAAEVEAKVVELDANVTPASVGNELRRHRNKRYRRDVGMRWFLVEDTERIPGLGRGDASPGSEAGETGLGMPSSGPPVGKAA